MAVARVHIAWQQDARRKMKHGGQARHKVNQGE